MAVTLASINGSNRLIAVTAGAVNLFTLDLSTSAVVSGSDSTDKPFFTPLEVANLSGVLKQMIAAATTAGATLSATAVANLITQLAAADANTYAVTTTVISGTNYQVVVTPSATPAVFAVQKPFSTQGSMGFGGAAAASGGGSGSGGFVTVAEGVMDGTGGTTQMQLQAGQGGALTTGNVLVTNQLAAGVVSDLAAYNGQKLLVLYGAAIVGSTGTPEAVFSNLGVPCDVQPVAGGDLILANVATFTMIAAGPTTVTVEINVTYKILAWQG
jgi:hypothetical protein